MEEKRKRLGKRIDELARENLILAFSGGVDSSLLLYMCCVAAKRYGTKVFAVTVHTKLHPSGDLDIAKKVAEEAGAEHKIAVIDELAEAGILWNPANRCYLCKKYLFQKLADMKEELDASYILEGTNEDDLHVYRPGIQALKELGIISPLAECGVTKEEVRSLAAQYGISVAGRPSTPCMATRFPYGTKLSYEELQRAERGECWLREQGFYNVRLRVHAEILRIEVDVQDMKMFLEKREEITEYMKELGYSYVTLDLEGFRSGSMDIHLQATNG